MKSLAILSCDNDLHHYGTCNVDPNGEYEIGVCGDDN